MTLEEEDEGGVIVEVMTRLITNLEELNSRLTLEEEDEGGVIVEEVDINLIKEIFVLVGLFLTEKTLPLMQCYMFLYMRPKEGMMVHDLGNNVALLYFIMSRIYRKFWMVARGLPNRTF